MKLRIGVGILIIIGLGVLGQSILKLRVYKQVKKDLSGIETVKPSQVLSPAPFTVRLLFGGDVMLDRHIRIAAGERGGYDFILNKMTNWLKGYELVIVNLEGPITNYRSVSVNSKPGGKGNYTFTFEPETASFLFKHNIRLVNLGNNHILNFGIKGLNQTLDFLNQNQVDYFGQPNKNQRWKIKNFHGFKIGFVSYNQFIKNGKKQTLQDLSQVKQYSDWIVVYAHWGSEYEPVASKEIVRLAHEFIDKGADIVIGSHPHVIQNWEKYKGKRIYYSLGNFIFDQYFSNEVKKGLLVGVTIIPITKRIKYEHYCLKLLPNGETKLVLKCIN